MRTASPQWSLLPQPRSARFRRVRRLCGQPLASSVPIPRSLPECRIVSMHSWKLKLKLGRDLNSAKHHARFLDCDDTVGAAFNTGIGQSTTCVLVRLT